MGRSEVVGGGGERALVTESRRGYEGGCQATTSHTFFKDIRRIAMIPLKMKGPTTRYKDGHGPETKEKNKITSESEFSHSLLNCPRLAYVNQPRSNGIG